MDPLEIESKTPFWVSTKVYQVLFDVNYKTAWRNVSAIANSLEVRRTRPQITWQELADDLMSGKTEYDLRELYLQKLKPSSYNDTNHN